MSSKGKQDNKKKILSCCFLSLNSLLILITVWIENRVRVPKNELCKFYKIKNVYIAIKVSNIKDVKE